MLELNNIKKDYYVGGETVNALKGVSIKFRKNEFVSILGPSGCGKTTMLNIIGGLDRYTSGDLLINSKSTKEYKDDNWDTYRNHSIGFIFQSYNLIPHQTVLENVELALTLSGVSKHERRQRAIDVLKMVGLDEKINNKPSQLSGGQMQRVAIARALINDPEIILADEPTGALDTKTSVQIMDILRKISKDKLIIMVTHNPDLAEQYSNRIIRLIDGEVVSDSNPYNDEQVVIEHSGNNKKKNKNTSMSFFTALSLSFKNLLIKKGRTLMVAFAGSIGIIGIALIMSVSNGFQLYIDKVQEDTLSAYPISLEASTIDYSSMLSEMQGKERNEVEVKDGYITSNNSLFDMIEAMQKMMTMTSKENNLQSFKTYLETTNDIKRYSSAIQYVYDLDFNIYNEDYLQVNPNEIFKIIMGEERYNSFMNMSSYSGSSYNMLSSFNVWSEMLDNTELIQSQYELVDGNWPTSYNQIVVVVDQNYQISDYVLYSLGLKDQKELEGILDRYQNGEEITTSVTEYKYEDILNLKYRITLPYQYYEYNEEDDIFLKRNLEDEMVLKSIIDDGIELEVVGILKAKEGVSATSISSTIAYTSALTDYYINKVNQSDIVIKQKANPTINVLTGLSFEKNNITKEMILQYIDISASNFGWDETTVELLKKYIDAMSEDEAIKYVTEQGFISAEVTYDENLKTFGYVDKSKPTKINIYALDFASKDIISDYIAKYNEKAKSENRDEDVITYTDYIALLLDSITTILDIITYVLIAFVAISLVVSSIMIGVITYISVLERTKEIGILRSIGARKRDISRVFTAETVVIGFAAGAIGILVTLILIIPINLIINTIAGFSLNAAQLPIVGGLLLILISMLLTVVAGLIPSKFAANRDPVEALRTE